MGEKFKIGLLVDRPSASKYVHEFAEWAQAHSNVCISHLILHAPLTAPEPKSFATRLLQFIKKKFRFITNKGVYAALSKIAFSFVLMLEQKILSRNKRYEDHLSEFDLLPLVPDRVTITPIISKSGF